MEQGLRAKSRQRHAGELKQHPRLTMLKRPFGGDAGDMSVTTGSLRAVDVPASSPSLYGLDGVNFFLAAVLAGFGPYVPAYLADHKWTQTDIGLVLTAGSVAGLLSQLPWGRTVGQSSFQTGGDRNRRLHRDP